MKREKSIRSPRERLLEDRPPPKRGRELLNFLGRPNLLGRAEGCLLNIMGHSQNV